MATTVTYKGQTLATVENQTKVLETAGTWVEDDITLTDVSGGGGEPDWDAWGASETPIYNKITMSAYPERSGAWAGVSADIIRYEYSGSGNISGANYMFWRSLASKIVMPYFTGTFASSSGYPFQNSLRLKTVDFKMYNILQQSFAGCSLFDTLIIRKTDDVCSLANINAFNGTHFASGGTGGTLYVPSALISAYQAATNWSTILGYANNQILPIEGSVYETQYADGTPIE